MKKLTLDDLKAFRDRLYLDIPDSALEADPYRPPYFHPGEKSDEMQYMRERRRGAGRLAAVAAVHRASRCRSRPPRRSATSSGARASRRSPPRWRSSGCSRT